MNTYVLIFLSFKYTLFDSIRKIFGVENARLTPSNAQHNEFLAMCNDYADKWKTENHVSIELLFLQLLSYYTLHFDMRQYIISIQTRMPILKVEKQIFQNLFCAGKINRN